jgi:Domain of unknown function (DUF4440)
MRARVFVSMLILIAITTSCTMWSEKKHAGWHQASGGEQFERLLWETVQRKDWVELEKHLSVTFTGLVNGRTLDRAAMLERFKAAEFKSFSLAEVTVTPNADTMTVAYLLTVQPGTPVRAMTVWQRQKSGWIAIAHAEQPTAGNQ